MRHEIKIPFKDDFNSYFSDWKDFKHKISKSTSIDDSLLIFKAKELMNKIQKNKLTASSICQVTTLPKETVRRKIKALVKKSILTQNKSEGILVGPGYKSVFEDTVPKTTAAISKLIKKWKETGVLDSLLAL